MQDSQAYLDIALVYMMLMADGKMGPNFENFPTELTWEEIGEGEIEKNDVEVFFTESTGIVMSYHFSLDRPKHMKEEDTVELHYAECTRCEIFPDSSKPESIDVENCKDYKYFDLFKYYVDVTMVDGLNKSVSVFRFRKLLNKRKTAILQADQEFRSQNHHMFLGTNYGLI